MANCMSPIFEDQSSKEIEGLHARVYALERLVQTLQEALVAHGILSVPSPISPSSPISPLCQQGPEVELESRRIPPERVDLGHEQEPDSERKRMRQEQPYPSTSVEIVSSQGKSIVNKWLLEDDEVGLVSPDVKGLDLRATFSGSLSAQSPPPQSQAKFMVQTHKTQLSVKLEESVPNYMPISKGEESLGLKSEVNQPILLDRALENAGKHPSAPREYARTSSFKSVSVVRRASDREALNGSSCSQCEKFYEAVSGEGLSANTLKKYCSRHRHEHSPPKTPPGFWDVSSDPDHF